MKLVLRENRKFSKVEFSRFDVFIKHKKKSYINPKTSISLMKSLFKTLFKKKDTNKK